MDKKTKKIVKKATKKVKKQIIKQAKKEPKKFAITVLIILLILAIVLGCLYFFGPLKDWLPNNENSSSSEAVSSEPISSENSSETSSESTSEIEQSKETKSTIEIYQEDKEEDHIADKGGLSSTDVDNIRKRVNSYYATIDNTYSDETLWTKLHEVTVPVKLTSYGDLRYSKSSGKGIGGNIDVDYSSSDPSKIIDFYTGAVIDGEWAPSSNWNREHVWCQSHGWWGEAENSKRNGGTDLHHLRPENPNINSSRNNSLYGEVSERDSKAKYYTLSGTSYLYGYLDGNIDPRPSTSSKEGVFEPTDRMKGDVARIIMYLLVRYKDVATPVTNIIYTSEGTPEASYALLLKWHEQDPVSNFEIRRNHKTDEIQGNRNPFIDYPYYAKAIWGDK